jgi:pSer/pThr/pTyr-binding forkhead associated (FHA) protein
MASLVIIGGEGEGRHLPLLEPLVSIGRDDACTFQLLDDQVSRKHLQLRLDPATGAHAAGDYRSANGVFINGRRITDPAPLRDGDKIRIGRTTLIYLAEDHPDAEAALAAARKKGEWKRSTIMRRD